MKINPVYFKPGNGNVICYPGTLHTDDIIINESRPKKDGESIDGEWCCIQLQSKNGQDTFYFNEKDAITFREEVKKSVNSKTAINGDPGFKCDVIHTGTRVIEGHHIIDHVSMGISEHDGRGQEGKWKIRLDDRRQFPSAEIYFNVEYAPTFRNAVIESLEDINGSEPVSK